MNLNPRYSFGDTLDPNFLHLTHAFNLSCAPEFLQLALPFTLTGTLLQYHTFKNIPLSGHPFIHNHPIPINLCNLWSKPSYLTFPQFRTLMCGPDLSLQVPKCSLTDILTLPQFHESRSNHDLHL